MIDEKIKSGIYLSSRWENILAKAIKGIGRWMKKNHWGENFFALPLRKPEARFSIKARLKSPAMRPSFSIGYYN